MNQGVTYAKCKTKGCQIWAPKGKMCLRCEGKARRSKVTKKGS